MSDADILVAPYYVGRHYITMLLLNLWFINALCSLMQGLNVYSILQHDTLVMSLGAIRKIEDRLHTPINR